MSKQESKAHSSCSCSTKEQQQLRDKELDKSLDLHNCVSARDCTGTVALNPESEDGLENYDETYHYEPVPAKQKVTK